MNVLKNGPIQKSLVILDNFLDEFLGDCRMFERMIFWQQCDFIDILNPTMLHTVLLSAQWCVFNNSSLLGIKICPILTHKTKLYLIFWHYKLNFVESAKVWQKIPASVFWQPNGSLYSKERKSNVKILIFVAICGKIQDHFGIFTIETE